MVNSIGSTIEGSSFSGLLTRAEIGHIRIGSAGNGRIRSRFVSIQPFNYYFSYSRSRTYLRRRVRNDGLHPTPTNTAASSMTPWQNLHGIITPNGLHFERHHAGVPAIDPDQHRLVLHGLVKRPLIFTMNDIVRFPSESHVYFLECSGNSFWTGNTPQSTVQHTHGEMSCCEWTVEVRDQRVKLLRFTAPEPGRTIGLAWRRTSPRKVDFVALGQIAIEALGATGRTKTNKRATAATRAD